MAIHNNKQIAKGKTISPAQLVLLIGRAGTGKTRFVKNSLLPKNPDHFIIDFNDEYPEVDVTNKAVLKNTEQSETKKNKQDDSFFHTILSSRKLLVIEGAHLMGNAEIVHNVISKLLINKNHYGYNIVMIFQDVINAKRFIPFTDHIICFDASAGRGVATSGYRGKGLTYFDGY